MAFSESERSKLTELKFVGNKIIERLEEMNFDSFDKLRKTTMDEILNKGALDPILDFVYLPVKGDG